jgi:hypothetical protein
MPCRLAALPPECFLSTPLEYFNPATRIVVLLFFLFVFQILVAVSVSSFLLTSLFWEVGWPLSLLMPVLVSLI